MPPRRTNPLAGIWPNSTAALLAGGPSLTAGQVAHLAPRHAFGDLKVAGVNDAYRICPFLDLLYGADQDWWQAHGAQAQAKIRASYVPADGSEPDGPHLAAFGLLAVPGRQEPGISTDPAAIHLGQHSGFQLLNIAIQAGARRILLLGYDCQAVNGTSHWFGDHPPGLRMNSPYERFAYELDHAAAGIRELGVEVLNCSPSSALKNYPRQAIEDALE